MTKTLTVFCGARPGVEPHYQQVARQLGQALAKQQIHLVYGGGGFGLMGALANGALDAGGQATGVITEELLARGAQLDRLTNLEVTSDMAQRKQRMIDLADGFIALPGGLGTLEEIAQVSSWVTLGNNAKPVVIYNVNHYYDQLAAFLQQMNQAGFLEAAFLQAIAFCDDLDQALAFMATYHAPAHRTYH